MTNAEFLSALDDMLPDCRRGRALFGHASGVVDAVDEVQRIAKNDRDFQYPSDLASAVLAATE